MCFLEILNFSFFKSYEFIWSMITSEHVLFVWVIFLNSIESTFLSLSSNRGTKVFDEVSLIYINIPVDSLNEFWDNGGVNTGYDDKVIGISLTVHNPTTAKLTTKYRIVTHVPTRVLCFDPLLSSLKLTGSPNMSRFLNSLRPDFFAILKIIKQTYNNKESIILYFKRFK